MITEKFGGYASIGIFLVLILTTVRGDNQTLSGNLNGTGTATFQGDAQTSPQQQLRQPLPEPQPISGSSAVTGTMTQQEPAQAAPRQRQAHQSIPLPPPLLIPPNSSPQMQSYLIARDQLVRDQITFFNEHLNDDPQSRALAMNQWRQQNASRFSQLQQLAQAISPSHSATTNQEN